MGRHTVIPAHPRWINWLWAHVASYFWEPCPNCGRMFGGHETSDTGRFMMDKWGGLSTCWRCDGVYGPGNITH